MDPEATIQRLAAAITTGDWSDAVAALNDYYRWRIRGGFEPMNGDARVDVLAARLADSLG